jgi:hypothetical protein
MSFEYIKIFTNDNVLTTWNNMRRHIDRSILESYELHKLTKIGQNVDDPVYDTLEDSICINLSNEIIEYEY